MNILLKFFFVITLTEVTFHEALARKDNKHNNGSRETAYSEHHNGEKDDDNTVIEVQRCRHNYHDSTEVGINRQINMFLQAGFVYDSMSQYFGRCDVALPGFAKFFQHLTKEQHEKAQTLQRYQNLRGGVVILQAITTPATTNWGSGLEAMSHALEMEKSINAALLELYAVCSQLKDPHAASFMQMTFLGPQVEKIYTISQYISNLERVGSGIGEYLFDKLPQS